MNGIFMKRLVGKISAEYILYYLQITFIGVFLIVLLAYNLSLSAQGFLDRQMYSENVKGVQLSALNDTDNQDGTDSVLDLSKLEANGDFMLYRYISDESSEVIRGVYGTDDVFDFGGYIAEGRFFSTEDYKNKTPCAVVGSGILKQTVEKNGKNYYGYNEQLYEVIGVFKQTDSDLDNTAYINLSCLLESDGSDGLYYVDAQSEAAVTQAVKSLESLVSGDFTASSVEYESVTGYGLDSMSNTLYIFAVLAALAHLTLTTILFITGRERTVAIQKYCGMTVRAMFVSYSKKMLVLVCASFASVLGAVWLFVKFLGGFFSMERLVWGHFAILAVLLLLLGFLITLLTVAMSKRVDIASVLKGR